MSGESVDVRHAREVIAAISEARERMAHYGVTEESFTSDENVEIRSIADSLLMCMLRVTEEAGKLSDGVQVRYPQVSWAGIRGMMNILAHDYGHVD